MKDISQIKGLQDLVTDTKEIVSDVNFAFDPRNFLRITERHGVKITYALGLLDGSTLGYVLCNVTSSPVKSGLAICLTALTHALVYQKSKENRSQSSMASSQTN
ncbi:MAG: hypothetical protein AABW88_04945 [Nanoarchaeota archaeon]